MGTPARKATSIKKQYYQTKLFLEYFFWYARFSFGLKAGAKLRKGMIKMSFEIRVSKVKFWKINRRYLVLQKENWEKCIRHCCFLWKDPGLCQSCCKKWQRGCMRRTGDNSLEDSPWRLGNVSAKMKQVWYPLSLLQRHCSLWCLKEEMNQKIFPIYLEPDGWSLSSQSFRF